MNKYPTLALLLILPALLLADELTVHDYNLQEGRYDPIPVSGVYKDTFDPEKMYSSAYTKNPQLAQRFSIAAAVTIQVDSDQMEGIGAIQPFVAAARRTAALYGANVLKYESGTELKTTHNTTSMTFTGYRLEFDGQIADPDGLIMLSAETVNNKAFTGALASTSNTLYPPNLQTKAVQKTDIENPQSASNETHTNDSR